MQARISNLLRREPVPPAALLEHCCAILDSAMRTQNPGVAAASSAPRFARLDAGDAADAAADVEPEPYYGSSLPLRSLQPGYPNYDARSRALIDHYSTVAQPRPAPVLPVDERRAKIDALAKSMEDAAPNAQARRIGTQIGGGYSRTQPLHQARYKRITIRPSDVAAWAMLRQMVPELAAATELTIANFPAPSGGEADAVDLNRAPDANLGNTSQRTREVKKVPPFADPQRVDLTFLTGASANPFYRRLTLPAVLANLIKDMDGEVLYDWHTDSFTRTASGVYAGENGEPSVKVVERRLEQQRLEKQNRVTGADVDWRY